nr:histone H2A.Z-specific chaperone CHZ1 [Ipomoea batatas]
MEEVGGNHQEGNVLPGKRETRPGVRRGKLLPKDTDESPARRANSENSVDGGAEDKKIGKGLSERLQLGVILIADGESDLSDDPLAEVDLDNILPSRISGGVQFIQGFSFPVAAETYVSLVLYFLYCSLVL